MEKKIELTSKQKKEANALFEKHNDLQQALADLAERSGAFKRMGWEKIHEWYPEIASQTGTYNQAEGIVTVQFDEKSESIPTP